MNQELFAYSLPFVILGIMIFLLYVGEHADKVPFLKDLVD
jgi:hypothetical protein